MATRRPSVTASVDSNEVVSLTGSALDREDAPKQNFLRRVSTAASNFFGSSESRTRSQSVASAAADLQNFGYTESDVFGAPIEPTIRAVDEESGPSLTHLTVVDTTQGLKVQEVPNEREKTDEAIAQADRQNGKVPLLALAVHETGAPPKVRVSFWSADFREYRHMLLHTLLNNYIFLVLGFAICLCIYWGSFYGRDKHLKRLNYLVVDGDGPQGPFPPLLGSTAAVFFQSPQLALFGTFEFWDYSKAVQMAQHKGISIEELAIQLVHFQQYSATYLIRENATAVMLQMLQNVNSTFSPSSDLMAVFYETGSDYNKVTNYIIPITQQVVIEFSALMRLVPWNQLWFNTLSSAQISAVVSEAPMLLTTIPSFQLIDLLPVPQAVFQAPLQVGLIYLVVFTFFQFVFTAPVQIELAKRVLGWRFVVVRLLLAQGSYFILGLAYVVLNTAFQMNFTATFGYLGFLVIWMFAYLTMASVGSLMETLVLLCVIIKPACIGLIILFVAVTNLAPVISPIPVCPNFYRYGYAMPVYNSYHLMNIAYFNSWKGNMGRYIGILVAWIVLSNAIMPFAMKYAFVTMKKRKEAALAASEAAAKVEAAGPTSVTPIGAAAAASAAAATGGTYPSMNPNSAARQSAVGLAGYSMEDTSGLPRAASAVRTPEVAPEMAIPIDEALASHNNQPLQH